MMNVQLLQGDCLEVMKELASGSVQVCVTSPPYYSLRDYGHDGQIGLEPTPELYIARLVEVFREVKRVLRADGVIWLNLGDSFWGGKGKSGYELPLEAKARRFLGRTLQGENNVPGERIMRPTDGKHAIIKKKDLIGIPWAVAFALRADGWYLRMDCIWHKPNAMPESIRDRPSKSHEYIFLLSKSAKYFYDAEAIAEESVTNLSNKTLPRGSQGYAAASAGTNGSAQRGNINGYGYSSEGKRNKRSVWSVPTRNYRGAHFATFPEALVVPCILAGTSAHGCCAQCGAPWGRVVTKELVKQPNGLGNGTITKDLQTHKRGSTSTFATGMSNVNTTVGWAPSCSCAADVVPCTVLDPFSGSGTTGAVAVKHGRSFIGIDLNTDYIDLARERIAEAQTQLPLPEVTP